LFPGAANNYYVPDANGDYYVVHVDGNGCMSAPSQVYNYIIDVIGELQLGVHVYPNPTENVFNVVFGGQPQEQITLKVMNSLGETVFEFIPEQAHTVIDLGQFANGVYYLQIIAGSDVKTIPVVKSK